jgi:hypothetical protein
MSDRTFARKKTATSDFSQPSLVSSTTPTLANPTRGFGLTNNNVIQKATDVSTEQQEVQSADNGSLEQLTIQEKPLSHDISRISFRRPQAKLTVGEPGDQYEQEADWMANRVMTMPNTAVQRQMSPLAQRKETSEEEKIQTKPLLQRSSNSSLEAGDGIESSLNSSKGGGSSLTNEVRSFMEPRFGADFSQVRVHTDSTAVQMSKELGAQAFTHGSDVYFGEGKAPGTNELTAHELTHVVQQGGNNQNSANLKLNLEKIQRKLTDNQQEDSAKKRLNETPIPKLKQGEYLTNQKYQFVNRDGKYYVRSSPQDTKDKDRLTNASKDPNELSKEYKSKGEGKINFGEKKGTKSVVEQKDQKFLGGNANATVLNVGGNADASASFDGQEFEVKAGAGVKVTLAGGDLTYSTPDVNCSFLGENLALNAFAKVSAEIAAEAKGDISLNIGKGAKGVKVETKAGLEGFAGAKAGLTLGAKLNWNKEPSKDVIGAYLGVEGFAGVAAAAKFTAKLYPSIKYEGYLGAAIGLGGAAKGGLEVHAPTAAKLLIDLAMNGYTVTWESIESSQKDMEKAIDWAMQKYGYNKVILIIKNQLTKYYQNYIISLATKKYGGEKVAIVLRELGENNEEVTNTKKA